MAMRNFHVIAIITFPVLVPWAYMQTTHAQLHRDGPIAEWTAGEWHALLLRNRDMETDSFLDYFFLWNGP